MEKIVEMLLQLKHAIARLERNMVAIKSVVLEVTGRQDLESREKEVDLNLPLANIEALIEFGNMLKQKTVADSYVSQFIFYRY